MFIQSVTIKNFRCFGGTPQTVTLSSDLTCLVGANGAGKTALLLALLRMFGVSADQRRVRRRDFHVPAEEVETPATRALSIEVLMAFPELANDDDGETGAVPQFFQQMAADDDGALKLRLRLDATWSDDGSVDGAVEEKLWAIHTLAPTFGERECTQLKAVDRARIQMIYVPAVRDGSAQVAAVLRGRLWRAIKWSQSMRDTLKAAGTTLNDAFGREAAVAEITEALERRWGEVHEAGINATPVFRPIDLRFQEFMRKVEVVFRPDEAGREANLEELSDGQRSLFHIAMTAATLDVESQLKSSSSSTAFKADDIALPALTLLAVEEPENNLSPFYLSRILRQVQDVAANGAAQAIVSSHSASILSRVDPEDVRYFRLDPKSRTASVKGIRLPGDDEDAEKFIREAVRTYPELYFAQFVVLGEGSSEEVVLPRVAEAMGLPIDRSFVAIVPLGGRHVNHLWRLLRDLEIPYATLLDLDHGRSGGGWGRIKNVCERLCAVGEGERSVLCGNELSSFDQADQKDRTSMQSWVRHLRQFGIFFCEPLDLDMALLDSFFPNYKKLEDGMKGPGRDSDAKRAVLGGEGSPDLYGPEESDKFRWYRYLFLGRGKPSTHLRVLSQISDATLAEQAPEPLKALVSFVSARLPSSSKINAP